jgi:hypothetical protein
MHVQTTDKTQKQIRSGDVDHGYVITDNCQVNNNKDDENDEYSPGGTHDMITTITKATDKTARRC